jgi:hypothetical protein
VTISQISLHSASADEPSRFIHDRNGAPHAPAPQASLVLATATTFIANANSHTLGTAYAAHPEKTLGSLESVNTGKVSPYDIRKIGRKSEPASQDGLT